MCKCKIESIINITPQVLSNAAPNIIILHLPCGKSRDMLMFINYKTRERLLVKAAGSLLPLSHVLRWRTDCRRGGLLLPMCVILYSHRKLKLNAPRTRSIDRKKTCLVRRRVGLSLSHSPTEAPPPRRCGGGNAAPIFRLRCVAFCGAHRRHTRDFSTTVSGANDTKSFHGPKIKRRDAVRFAHLLCAAHGQNGHAAHIPNSNHIIRRANSSDSRPKTQSGQDCAREADNCDSNCHRPTLKTFLKLIV